MNKKLTLNIDEQIIQFAHAYVQQTRQSISSLVETYLRALEKNSRTDGFSPRTESLYGILLDTPLPDKKEMRRQFHEKHLG